MGSEGANEFTVPANAYLNKDSKYAVACGLRASGFVESSSKNGLYLAAPVVAAARRTRREEEKEREIVRSLNFLKKGSIGF